MFVETEAEVTREIPSQRSVIPNKVNTTLKTGLILDLRPLSPFLSKFKKWNPEDSVHKFKLQDRDKKYSDRL